MKVCPPSVDFATVIRSLRGEGALVICTQPTYTSPLGANATSDHTTCVLVFPPEAPPTLVSTSWVKLEPVSVRRVTITLVAGNGSVAIGHPSILVQDA